MKRKKFEHNETINMTINDNSNFLSPYSQKGKPVISSEVADFLENCANEFHPREKLTLNISGKMLTPDEEIIYKEAIRNYYKLKLKDLLRTIKRKNTFCLIWIIIGIVTLSVMIVFTNLELSKVIIECIDIFAWVFIWEAVDTMFVQRGGTLLQIQRTENFITMNITFEKKEGI